MLSLSQSGKHKVRVGSKWGEGSTKEGSCVRSDHTGKKIDVVFLQETHSDKDNEIDWGLSWKGQGLFSPGLDVNIISTTEIVTGSALVVRAETQHMSFVF